MPLPTDFTTTRVFGTFTNFDGTPAVGTVTFSPSVPIRSALTNTKVLPSPLVVYLNSSGVIDVNLPATDDPDITPSEWTYVVEERIGVVTRKYNMTLPMGGDVDLTGVVPAVPSTSLAQQVLSVNGVLPDPDGNIEIGNDLLIDVKDFGATGNGSTDDTAAIQAALNAVPAGGGTVYFPPGTYKISIADAVNKLSLRVSQQNTTLRGFSRGASVIKLANGVGDYTALISDATANGTTDLSGLTIRDLTIDQNSANNVITAVGPGDPLFTGRARYVVRFFVGKRLTIENCRFTNIDNVNTIAANGGPTLQDVVVRNNLFDNVGANSPKHDHSTIYTNAARQDISGNTFVGGGISATTAIETHGDTQVVHHNQIINFFAAANITGIAASSIGVVVDGNVARGVGTGIVIWSRTYTGNSSGFGIEDLVVSNNTIEVDLDQWAAVVSYKCGIQLDVGSNYAVHNVVLRNNVIRYKTFATVPTATDNLSAGIQLYRTGVLASTDVGVDVVNNVIDGPPAAGVYVNLKSTTVRHFRLTGNRITNPGAGNSPNFASTFKCGVLLIGAFDNSQVSGNQITDDRGTRILSAGIDASLVTSTVNCESADNSIFIADGTVVPGFLTAAGTTWQAGKANTGLFTATRYYTAPSNARTTVALSDGQACAHPFWVGQPMTFDRIGANVTTAVAASAVRLGIYADTGRGSPGQRVLDAGTIDSTSTGSKELTISKMLSPGLYWLVTVPQGGAPTLQAHNGTLNPVGAGSLATATGAGGTFSGLVTAAGAVAGALPASFPAINNYQAFSPVVALRAA